MLPVAPTVESANLEPDLGPLAWVLDELRKSLDSANMALRRFVRDAELSRGSDIAALDASHLRIARQQLHQAVGALEMVGFEVPARMLRAMEALVQKFVQKPEFCSDDAALRVEHASFALTDYLEAILKGKKFSSVALFPQYRNILDLTAADRIHPADLWAYDWHWINVDVPGGTLPLSYDSSVRTRVDGFVLNVVKTGQPASALAMRDISLGFAAHQVDVNPRVFWMVSAAFFEAIALGLCASDLYIKRAASHILLQYRNLARGQGDISEQLVRDLLFFCAQAVPSAAQTASTLRAVQHAYGVESETRVDYQKPQFGRFDPTVLAQARKRVAAAAETWSTLSGGDVGRIKTAVDQFGLVADSVVKLHPENREFAAALTRALDGVVRAGKAPEASVAMEVATAVLYLEAAYEDMDPDSSQTVERGVRLAQRLDHVMAGGLPEPLDPWMQELYRRVSDRQVMGSVVDELRTTLGEVEAALDTYFRRPEEKLPLQEVPGRLSQMRGVFSVLGLDQAAVAALRMRDGVERLLIDGFEGDAARTAAFEKLGNSLGTMGFLIDMLSYQREMAKKLFVYDDELGEFRSLMGIQKAVPTAEPVAAASNEPVPGVSDPAPESAAADALTVDPLAPLAAALVQPVGAPVAAPAAVVDDDDDDIELRSIFLEEAREVVKAGLENVAALHANNADFELQTGLRRAYHTLKGSSRMVGLTEFGEAAWALEQLLNAWLPQQRPISADILKTSQQALESFSGWVEAIAMDADDAWRAQPFVRVADSLRLDEVCLDLAREPGQPPYACEPLAASPLVVDELPAVTPTVASEATSEPLAAPVADVVPEVVDEMAPEPVAEVAAQAGGEDFSPTLIHDFVDTKARDFAETLLSDFGDFGAAPVPAQPVPENVPEDVAPAALSIEDPLAPASAAPALQALPPKPETALAPEPESSEPQEQTPDDQIKLIGSLRIGIALYNVYLNEADEWSRRLLTELTEWSLELNQPVPESPVALAHSLAGSSATVGFTALSGLARTFEHAMEHTRLGTIGLAEHARLFVNVAEDIRRLLHQFAAGFLKEPDVELVAALQAILETDFSTQESLPEAWPDEQATPSQVADLVPVPADVVEPPAPLVLAGEEEIEAVDALDVDLFPIFEEEALELLPQLGGALRQWCARPDNLGARQEALRLLHTLKGSARLSGAMRLGEMAHRMESAVQGIDPQAVQSGQLDPVMARFDAINACFEKLRATPLDALVLPEASAVTAPLPEEFAAGVSAPALPIEEEQKVSVWATPAPSLVTPAAPVHRSSGQTIRVKSQLVDRMVDQAGEVMISRSRLEARLGQLRGSLDELSTNLERLRAQLRDIEVQSESQMQSRLAQTKDVAQGFDPLEFDRFTRVQELTRMMAESVHDVATLQRNLQQTVAGVEDDLIAQARQTRELQRFLLRTRMVEFDSIAERLFGVVRQACKDFDKQVKLEIHGGALELDRGVLERVVAAFEHILRNAVGHGIERAAVRQEAGKPAGGVITVSVEQQSNDVAVTFTDDGAGLDLTRIRTKALERGLITADQTLSDAQVANLIFASGLSTASEVSEMAGRGIGMDVVRSEVNSLGGRIEVSTQSGRGSQFKLVMPLTTAVNQIVLFRCGEMVMGVPASLVELVRRVPSAELDAAYASGNFSYNGAALPFFWSGALLQTSTRSAELQGKTASVGIFRSAGQHVAVHVDEVLGNQEVVVKNLGPQLSRLPGLAGMSMLASGAVVLIYNMVALSVAYGDQARAFVAAPCGPGTLEVQPAVANQLPLVLVVDDSITVRRVTQRLLKREGFRVALASDGLQALEQLALEKPSVVLTDIEMPRMDGFDLVRNIRADANLKDLPVIMITSRIAQKHRDYARELQVDHYLGKPYPEDELIGLVRSYCVVTADA